MQSQTDQNGKAAKAGKGSSSHPQATQRLHKQTEQIEHLPWDKIPWEQNDGAEDVVLMMKYGTH